MAVDFLKAEWRKLVMINFKVDEKILLPYLPAKTEIDLWKGSCYVSLVGFMFLNVRILGIKIPFHVNFEEVNLRFYVRYNDKGVWKRGVVFIKEIVPKHALTWVANTVYGEKYETMPMKHDWTINNDTINVSYSWKKQLWHMMNVSAQLKSEDIIENSEEMFITEHYWGYTKRSNVLTGEYGVEHPKWKIYPVNKFNYDVDFGLLYGSNFSFLKNVSPSSVFLAEGSEIVVKSGNKI